MSKEEAANYLKSLLGRHLRVTTTDTRIFLGEFKCTDNERNIILSGTHEYRYPTASAVQATASASSSIDAPEKLRVNMTSRFLGLVIVPGQYITKIELEDYL